MSIHNDNNRPSVGLQLGNLNSDATELIFHAGKAVELKSVRLLSRTAISGDGTNHVSFSLAILDESGTETPIPEVVATSEGGLRAGQALELLLPDGQYLEDGESLLLKVDEMGTATFPGSFCSIDYEVKGN